MVLLHYGRLDWTTGTTGQGNFMTGLGGTAANVSQWCNKDSDISFTENNKWIDDLYYTDIFNGVKIGIYDFSP